MFIFIQKALTIQRISIHLCLILNCEIRLKCSLFFNMRLFCRIVLFFANFIHSDIIGKGV